MIDFLRGSQSAKIRDVHRQLKTYGVGSDLSRDNWRHYLNELIHEGLLKRSAGQYPVIELTEKSHAVLKGETKVKLSKAVEVETAFIKEEAPELHADLEGY